MTRRSPSSSGRTSDRSSGTATACSESGADAEDATQDTLERAWRRLTTYDGSGPFGAWLHRIATNVCLDALRRRRARVGPGGYGPPMPPGGVPAPPDPELAWVEPVSDAELTGTGDPQDELVRREEISLAFVAALQRLAPRQRAALLLHDVLGFSHAEVCDVLSVSASAVNSLLSRARAQARPSSGAISAPPPNVTDPRVRQLLERYVQAWRLADIDEFVRLVTEDVCFSMPPMSMWFSGRAAAAAFLEQAIFGPARPGGILLLPGYCNGQPAFGTYAPDASGRLAVNGLQVLQLAEAAGRPLISALVSYRDPAIAIRCGLPEFLS